MNSKQKELKRIRKRRHQDAAMVKAKAIAETARLASELAQVKIAMEAKEVEDRLETIRRNQAEHRAKAEAAEQIATEARRAILDKPATVYDGAW